MPTVRRERDRAGGTMLGANRAAGAVVLHDIPDQRFAPARWTATGNVRFVFIPEILEGGDHRIGCALAQAAQAGGHDLLAEHFQGINISGLALASADLVKDFQDAAGAHPAGSAFTAGFKAEKFHECDGQVDNAGAFIAN